MIDALIEERKRKRRESAKRWYHANKAHCQRTRKVYGEKNKQALSEKALARLRARPYIYLVAQARVRANKKKLACDITLEWARHRWTGRCELTGLAFRVGLGQHPFSPSIDRKDRKKGYTMANCRFILLGVNMLKHVGTEKQMYQLANAVVSSRK